MGGEQQAEYWALLHVRKALARVIDAQDWASDPAQREALDAARGALARFEALCSEENRRLARLEE